MARLDDIVAEKLRRLEAIPDELVTATERAQQRAFTRLVELMGGMDTVDGRFVMNEANVLRTNEIVSRLINDDLMDGDYGKALRGFLQQFGVQGDLTDEMFAEIIKDFTALPNWRATITGAQVTTLQSLGSNGINQAFGQPIRQQLQAAIAGEGGFEETIEALRTFVLDNEERLGSLMRHVKQIAYDAFAFTERSYSHVVAEDIGIEWYRYVGGTVRDTRDFCRQRTGKVYHKTEIQAWAGLTWGGKTRGTSGDTIWTYAGGYNCGHSFVPVATSQVPDEVKARI